MLHPKLLSQIYIQKPPAGLIFAEMSLPLRITLNNKDYTYTILTKGIGKETSEIKIQLEGEELTIARNSSGNWDVMERTITDDDELLKAITRNVVLRYRLK